MRIVVTAVLALVACASPDATGTLTDAQLIEIARRTPEAREFDLKWPGAHADVDRSGRLAVDLRGRPARLRQFLVNGVAVEPFLDCPAGTMHTRDVVVAIRACG